MKPSVFTAAKTGELVSVSGMPGVTHAFVPNPLPTTWEWPTDLWPLLLEARTSLAGLDAIGRYLPNPELLLTPLQNREANRSSSLEGTVTDPQQQALFKVEPRYPASPEDPVNAEREVFNYGRALRIRLASPELPLSLRLIRQLHAVLMDGVRGADQTPGEFRRLQNQVGKPARYVPPPVDRLAGLLDVFEKYLHQDHRFDPLVEAFLVHYQFEAIHPFSDGNGRVGRLFLALCIAEWCGLTNQWLYMSAYFDRNKDHYIDRMFRVSTHGDWSEWIRFCLQGVVETAADTQRRCDRLLALRRTYHDKLAEVGGSVRLSAIVDDLFDAPVAIVTHVQRRHGVSYPTARSDLRRLEKAGILKELPGVAQISYYCAPILAITHEDII
ncbi:MAG: Fic family protein [Proteobacteria bacterium]|nr:Fic family protein [Pseudomonadota bacterium]